MMDRLIGLGLHTAGVGGSNPPARTTTYLLITKHIDDSYSPIADSIGL
jgi:hypothetical protein